MKLQTSPFAIYLIFFFAFIIFLIGAITTSKFLGLLPTNSVENVIPNLIYNSVFGLFDKSFIFFLIIALFADAIISYYHPDRLKGTANIILLFCLVFIFAFIQSIDLSLNTAFSANIFFPITYSVFNNNYSLFLLCIISILSIIFNFRHENQEKGFMNE